MLPLRHKDRVRILAAVARTGPAYLPRRIAAITCSLLILLLVPLLGLVRVDLWGGRHLLFNERVDGVTAFKGFVVAMAALYGFTFLTNMVVGRFFCGWGCPVGYVSRLGEEVELKSRTKWKRLRSHLSGAGFVATFVAAIMLWWVDPRVLVEGSWLARGVTVLVFLGLSAGGYLHAFRWRFGFCVHVCPIGLYYRYVTSRAPVGIVFEEVPSPCIACGACEKVCPVAIDPKALGQPLPATGKSEALRYGDAECIRCGDCVEACRMVFAKRPADTPPLRFGRNRDSRPSLAPHGEATAASSPNRRS